MGTDRSVRVELSAPIAAGSVEAASTAPATALSPVSLDVADEAGAQGPSSAERPARPSRALRSRPLDAAARSALEALSRRPGLATCAVRISAAVAIRAWLHGVHRLAIEGRENLPLGESFVMISNHQSHLDAPALAAAIRLPYLHQTFPAAAADYFFRSTSRSILSSVVINGLPFHRTRGASKSLAVCRELLRGRANVLILFPEGTRSQNGELGRFRPGIGRLVIDSNVPVVPCHLDGAFAALPKGAVVPRPAKLTLRIGEPRRYGHLAPGRDAIRHICDDLREAVRALAPSSAPPDHRRPTR